VLSVMAAGRVYGSSVTRGDFPVVGLSRDGPVRGRLAFPSCRPSIRPGTSVPHAAPQACLPTSTPSPPAGPNWLHEIKHDGYRMLAHHDGARVRLASRMSVR
jgi:hypothetical protein